MKTALILEINKQLDNAGIVINDFFATLDKLYIDPHTHYDMNAYVEVGFGEYRLQMRERGQVIFDERTTKVKVAAYYVLLDMVARAARKSAPEPSEEERQLKAAYFAKMDEEYARWYSEGINAYKIGQIL